MWSFARDMVVETNRLTRASAVASLYSFTPPTWADGTLSPQCQSDQMVMGTPGVLMFRACFSIHLGGSGSMVVSL